MCPPWPGRYKRRNPTLVPVVRARFEPRCGRPHIALTCNGVRVCGRNRTEDREREWAEGTVSSPVQSTGHVKLSDKILPSHWNCAIGWWGSGPAQQVMLKGNNPPSSFFRKKKLLIIFTIQFFILFSETLIISQTKSWVLQSIKYKSKFEVNRTQRYGASQSHSSCCELIGHRRATDEVVPAAGLRIV